MRKRRQSKDDWSFKRNWEGVNTYGGWSLFPRFSINLNGKQLLCSTMVTSNVRSYIINHKRIFNWIKVAFIQSFIEKIKFRYSKFKFSYIYMWHYKTTLNILVHYGNGGALSQPQRMRSNTSNDLTNIKCVFKADNFNETISNI